MLINQLELILEIGLFQPTFMDYKWDLLLMEILWVGIVIIIVLGLDLGLSMINAIIHNLMEVIDNPSKLVLTI